MNGWTDELMDGWMKKQRDGWVDGQISVCFQNRGLIQTFVQPIQTKCEIIT